MTNLTSPWFALTTTNGVTCVDRCGGGVACGEAQGNIIAYPCWNNINSNPSQRWKWIGTPDSDGGQMIASERDTTMCITSCPSVSSRCAFVGDASTAPCNANDIYQRWYYKP